ncbi:3-oxoacyl-ACP synthase III family protein [Kitasatospora sp. NPDC056800]|uniref:3-oxoacyl-ACP synthase III family protein n=1 Tax=Kitasatospora sp. NPDC056800 TaxID=3345948 RepID=UPI0036CE0BA4
MRVHVPEARQSSREIEEELCRQSPGAALPTGLLEHMFGLRERCVAAPGDLPSDLAARAGAAVLEDAGLPPEAIDLLVYTGITKDLDEPATANVVAAKLGVTAPVFDLMNACNGVLSALESADALIRLGSYRRVLVVTGEAPSRLTRWRVPDRGRLASAMASLTLGDMGAAVLVEASERPGILGSRFFANPAAWPSAVLRSPYATGRMHELEVDDAALTASFAGLREQTVKAAGELIGAVADCALFCVHQPSAAMTRILCSTTGIPEEAVIPTFAHHGNVATSTIPLQLVLAQEQGRLREGDLVGIVGLASGTSVGVMALRW